MSEHWRWTKPKARKEAQCHGCYRMIRVGEQYNKCEGLHDIAMGAWRECAHCDALVRIYDNIQDPYEPERPGVDGIGAWEPQHEDNPLQALRHRAYWHKQWTRKDGTLYPVPEKLDPS